MQTEVQLYPNPISSNNNATIQILTGEEGPATIEVIDVLGRRLQSQLVKVAPGENTFALETNGLASGVYFVTVRLGTYYEVIKLEVSGM